MVANQNNNAKPAVVETNKRVNCQCFPSPEVRQGVQCSPELMMVLGYLLSASQQGLVLPFVCHWSASVVSVPDIIRPSVVLGEHLWCLNVTANGGEKAGGWQSSSSKRMVAVETVEQAGCHGI